MPVSIACPPIAESALDRAMPPRKIWSRRECEKLDAAGLLEGSHLELIGGELIDKMGKKRPHVNATAYLLRWLAGVFDLAFVNPESSIDVAPEDNPTNEPEPDIVVLSRPSKDFRDSNPQPGDLQLVIEISDSTLTFDLRTKAALYARAGIADYWVLDVKGRRLVVHREPLGGSYQSVIAYGIDESVSPLAKPGAEFLVRDAFPE